MADIREYHSWQDSDTGYEIYTKKFKTLNQSIKVYTWSTNTELTVTINQRNGNLNCVMTKDEVDALIMALQIVSKRIWSEDENGNS